MALDILTLIAGPDDSTSLVERLESLPYDELVEIDIANNVTRNIHHVKGKYFVPMKVGPYKEMRKYTVNFMIHPDDRKIQAAFMDEETIFQRLADSPIPGAISAHFRYRLQDGGWRWVEQIVIGGKENGLNEGVIRFYVIDIQNRIDREQGHLTHDFVSTSEDIDVMTGLIREKAFFTQAGDFVEKNDCDGWCLIAIDIENFKLFNDWYGRDAGDFTLAQIGAFLGETQRQVNGVVGYLGQDNFALIAPYDEAKIEALYNELNKLIASHGASIGFSPALGISMIDDNATVLDLYDRATLALVNAKLDFRNPIRVFQPSMYEKNEEEYLILVDFQAALERKEICYHVQPQCRISNGKIVGVEILCRWQKENGAMIPPEVFIPVLEKNGFITDLDCHVWDMACSDASNWVKTGHKAVPFSINISQVDFYTIDVPSYLEELANRYDIPHSMIKAEITESAYVNDTEVIRDAVQRLRESGFVVLMDDFGSGYSSLNMLSSLNVDVVKLDAEFLEMGEDARRNIHIIESIVNMTKTMNMPIICEGVETIEQAKFLEKLGCRYIQGFLYYRPMPPKDFEWLIHDGELIDDLGFVTKPNEEFRIREFLDRNVYSDSMLNSIIGAVAIVSWHDDKVDIIRFNENFYEAIADPHLDNRLNSIQDKLVPNDRNEFAILFEKALNDQLNGSVGAVRFSYKPDGSITTLLVHLYYLEEQDEGKLFYCSIRDVTDIVELQKEMQLLSSISQSTVVFLRELDDGWKYNVVIHGLEELMGLTQSELLGELENGSFYKRIDAASAGRALGLADTPEGVNESFVLPFTMTNARNENVEMVLISDYIENNADNVVYIFTFRTKSVLEKLLT